MSTPQDPRPAGQQIADPAAVLKADLARQAALDLRAKGFTYRQIAAAMNVSVSTAHDYVNDGWARLNADSDDLRRVLRCIEDERLEELLAVSMPIALGEVEEEGVSRLEGILKGQMVVLRISQRKANLYGLDETKEVKASGGKANIVPLAQLRARVQATRAALAAQRQPEKASA